MIAVRRNRKLQKHSPAKVANYNRKRAPRRLADPFPSSFVSFADPFHALRFTVSAVPTDGARWCRQQTPPAVHLRTPNFASEPLHKDKVRFDLCHQSLTGDLPGP